MTAILDNFQHAIYLAPCTLVGDAATSTVGTFSGLGINSIPSEDWETDVGNFCNLVGVDSDSCAWMSSIDADFSGRIGSKLGDHLA